MKHIHSIQPRVRRALSGVLCVAVLAALLLPMLQLGQTEPENPILHAHAQEITVLESGGGADAATGDGSGTQIEQDDTAPPEDGSEEAPDDPQPDEPQPSEQQPTDSAETSEPGEDTIPDDTAATEEADAEALDVSAVLTWYKYGTDAATVVCATGGRVGRRILAAQLPGGRLRYAVSLSGLDAESAEITDVRFAPEHGRSESVELRGTQRVTLPEAGQTLRYTFEVEARVQRRTDAGLETENLSFTFVLRLEDDLDLDLRLEWDAVSGTQYALCAANTSSSASVSGQELVEGIFSYRMQLEGEHADDAQILSAECRADGQTQTMEERGELLMHAAEDSDRMVYVISVLAQVEQDGSVQRVQFTIMLTYVEQPYDLSLELTWYRNGTDPQTVSCEANSRVGLSIYSNQLVGGELHYRLGLTGSSEADAELLTATLDEAAIDPQSGTVRLSAEDGTREYTLRATARITLSGERTQTVTFAVTIRYGSDVSICLHYTVTVDGAPVEREMSCQNGKTETAEPVYSDQLTDDTLHYRLTTAGETDITIREVRVYSAGTGHTRAAEHPSGSVTLATNDGAVGDNVFTVHAYDADGNPYQFTINIPYKPRGNGTVRFELNLADGDTVTNGTEVNLTVRAWSEDADGNFLSRIMATGTNTTLRVQLDGADCQVESVSGDHQQYILVPTPASRGDTNTHTLSLYGEDAYGNSGTLSLTLTGLNTEAGQVIGTARISVDLTALGLGVSRAVTYSVLSEEPISYSVAKAIWGYDAGEPFGTADDVLWPDGTYGYTGTLDDQFYLEMLDDGSNLGTRASALRLNRWDELGQTEEEQLAAIDAYFGAGSDLAILWRCLRRNGVEVTGGSTDGRLRAFDFTMGSGWLYSLNGSYYPGSAMSSYRLQDGDTLTLRFTLAYGWDVGSGSGSYGSSAGYCVTAMNGNITVHHDFERTGEAGHIQYVCRCCGTVQDCPHEQTLFRALDDATCEEYCAECGETVRTTAHELECTPLDDTSHAVACSLCDWTGTQAHDWQSDDDTATCTEPGTIHSVCTQCGAEHDESTPALGHDEIWGYDESGHWKECCVCEERIDGTAGRHHYEAAGGDWLCTDCQTPHLFACDGDVVLDEAASDCEQEAYHCDVCGYDFRVDGVFPERHVFSDGYCQTCGTPDPDYMPDPGGSGDGDGDDEDENVDGDALPPGGDPFPDEEG